MRSVLPGIPQLYPNYRLINVDHHLRLHPHRGIQISFLNITRRLLLLFSEAKTLATID